MAGALAGERKAASHPHHATRGRAGQVLPRAVDGGASQPEPFASDGAPTRRPRAAWNRGEEEDWRDAMRPRLTAARQRLAFYSTPPPPGIT